MENNEIYIIRGYFEGVSSEYESYTRGMTIEEIEKQLRDPDIFENIIEQWVDQIYIFEPIFNHLHENYNEKIVASYLVDFEKRTLVKQD